MTTANKIILLVIDTLRADHLGCYGYPRNTSPAIDHLAANAIVFSHAFTPVSYTLPSIASLLTSKRPDSHGIGLSQTGKLSEDADLTLAELLRENGFATAAFVSTIVLNSATNLSLGFDVYDDTLKTRELNRPDYLLRHGHETVAAALDYLRRHREENVFAFIHLMDVHGPYICPAPYDAMFAGDSCYGKCEALNVVSNHYPFSGIPEYQVLGAPNAGSGDYAGFISDARYYRARYDACIRSCDEIISRLLDGLKRLGIYDDALFILTADHGEALGENQIYFFHGVTVTPEQLLVPLIVKPPFFAHPGSQKLNTHVSLMDLMPTILTECGIDVSDLDLHGRPLQDLIMKGHDPQLSARTLLCVNECQDALIRPEGTMELQRSGRAFQGYYAYVPELIDRLSGRHYSWETGKEISAAAVLRRMKTKRLRQAISDKPLSSANLMRIAYLLGSLALPSTAKHMILSLAPQLKARYGNSEPSILRQQPDAASQAEMLGIDKLRTVTQSATRDPAEHGRIHGRGRRLRVALFVHCFFPKYFFGTETYTLQIADNLRRMGHEPIVVSAAFPGDLRQKHMLTEYTHDGIPVICVDMNFAPPGRLRQTYYNEALRGVYKDLLQKIRPDIVHVTHLINHTAVLPDVADALGLAMVATMTDFFGICFNCRLQTADGAVCSGPSAGRTGCIACFLRTSRNSRLGRLAAAWPRSAAFCLDALSRIPILQAHPYAEMAQDIKERPNILAAQYAKYRAVIAPTRFLREAYAANGLTQRCYDIPYGVDLPRDPKPERAGDQPLTFGFMGQIAHHKGADLLVKAFAQLPKGSAKLLIYGPEDRDPGFIAELRRAADGCAVSFQGAYPFEKTYDVLKTLDVLVIPSRWGENGPLVLLNALATHTPVVVSDAGGLTEFITDGKSGFKFALGSAAALEQAMQRFIQDPRLATRLSRSTEYSWTSRAMTEEVLKVYEYALS